MKDWFGRFSYDFSDNISGYVQGSWAMATNLSDWVNITVSANANRPNTLFANNPFLAPATQQQLGASIACGTPAATGWRCLPSTPPSALQIELGLRGTMGNFNWDFFYNFGESVNKVTNPNNTDNAKYLASLDAVIAPPGTTIPRPTPPWVS